MEVNQKIREILSNILLLPKIHDDIDQINCEKWDSLRHLFIMVELENEFGFSFEPEEIAEMKTLREIERIVDSKITSK